MNMASPVQNNLTALAQHKRQIPSFFVRLLWALKMQSVCKSQPSTICTASFISFGAIRHFTVHAGPKSVVAPAAGFSRQACPLKGPGTFVPPEKTRLDQAKIARRVLNASSIVRRYLAILFHKRQRARCI